MLRPGIPTPLAVEHVQYHPLMKYFRKAVKYTLNGGPVNMLTVTHLGTEVFELGGPVPHNTQQRSVLNLQVIVHTTGVHAPMMTVQRQKTF